MNAPANFIRLRSVIFDAAIAGVDRTCRIEGGNLIIPVVDTDEAFGFIGKLGELPATEREKMPTTLGEPTAGPLDGLAKTEQKLRDAADAIERASTVPAPPPAKEERVAITKPAPDSKAANGVHAPAKPAVDPAGASPNLFTGKEPEKQVNAAPLSDEPKTGVRAKSEKGGKKDKAEAKDPDAKPRNVTDDVADLGKETAAADAKPAAAAKDPEPTKPAAEETAAEGTATSSSGLDEGYMKSAAKLRDILNHMHENGLKSFDQLVAACSERKASIAILSKIPNMEDRVGRTLNVMGFTPAEVPGMPQVSDG